MRLKAIPAQTYAREVLPLTAPLWAGERTAEQYVAQTLQFAASAYGRRHYATYGLYDGSALVSSFKRYERTIRHQSRRLRALGLGAVFTPAPYRGRGYASYMLASALDDARRAGYDVAYLFSDIRPHFYAPLGFRALASREFTTIADELPSRRLKIAPLDPDHLESLRRCFERSERRRPAAFLRGPLIWQSIATRTLHESGLRHGQRTNLGLFDGPVMRAYVLGVRAPQRDAYIVEEFAFYRDADRSLIPPLLRAAAGDLRRIAGWLQPGEARHVLTKPAIRRRKRAIFMIAPLSANGKQFLDAIVDPKNGDFCWANDHV